MARHKNRGSERTRNDRQYLVTINMPGRPPYEVHTSDPRRARKVFDKEVAAGHHVVLKQHDSIGRWETVDEADGAQLRREEQERTQRDHETAQAEEGRAEANELAIRQRHGFERMMQDAPGGRSPRYEGVLRARHVDKRKPLA